MDTPNPVSFTFTFADYRSLNRLMRRESVWKRKQFILVPVAFALAMVGVIAILALLEGRSVVGAMMGFGTSAVFWAAVAASAPLVWLLNAIELRLYYRRQRLDGAAVTVRFDGESGITSEGSTGSGSIAWKQIRKLVSDPEAHVLLYENRVVGLCLPRRAFSSQQAFDDTARFIAARIAAAQVC